MVVVEALLEEEEVVMVMVTEVAEGEMATVAVLMMVEVVVVGPYSVLFRVDTGELGYVGRIFTQP